jgi:hypothetical protein
MAVCFSGITRTRTADDTDKRERKEMSGLLFRNIGDRRKKKKKNTPREINKGRKKNEV